MRRKTRVLSFGDLKIGGDNEISVQSMTNTDTRDVQSTVAQIQALEKAGCQLIRLAVVDEEAADALKLIKREIKIPMVADIHFDHKLALKAIDNGVDGLRINPGNIGSSLKVKEIVERLRDKKIPIRIGVNGGSLERELLSKYGGVTKDALVESALNHIAYLEKLNYEEIKVSVKSSNVPLMIESYRKLSTYNDYPLHLGVTEAGTLKKGLVKSAIGIGTLLYEGIGDTIRVSLTDDPLLEVEGALDILKVLGLREEGINLISCPTCGRTEINLIQLAKDVELLVKDYKLNIEVAVMGCPVNGPGEARNADIGIAGGKGVGLIFKKGEIIKKVPEKELLRELKNLLDELV